MADEQELDEQELTPILDRLGLERQWEMPRSLRLRGAVAAGRRDIE